MSESLRMWVEIIFNLMYLIIAWALVGLMARRRSELTAVLRRQADAIIWAFALLSFGDTGHVGLRVLAYALGGLESRVIVLGRSISLVGAGSLMTSVTVTLFYVLLLDFWRARFGRRFGWFEKGLLLIAGLRLVILAFAQNEWWRVVPPQPWSTIRNFPLTVLGLGVAYLMLRQGRLAKDRSALWMGMSILVSYACYIPVILYVQRAPMLGMLMIPKTLAYVAIALLAYFDLYWKPRHASALAAA